MVKSIGVIGGGQLARMMIVPAIHLGLDLKVLAENPDSSAKLAATQVGDYKDPETVFEFAKSVDVITFDHEHVPEEILRELVARGKEVHPSPDALQYAQDKIRMREKLTRLGIAQPEWAAVSNEGELQEFIDARGGQAVVKTARGGYDGKGVRVIKSASEASDWLQELAPGENLLAEERVEFTRELAQLVARRPSGQVRAWPVVETVQKGGVCAEVLAPAPTKNEHTLELAAEIGHKIAEGVAVTGVLAVEMFETTGGEVLVNELAMRPHNSGHFTIEGSVTSQFEQHLRAVSDLPLGATAMTAAHAVMVNVLGGPKDGSSGTMAERYDRVLAQHPRAKVHSYDKEPRPGRKLGHITVTGENLADIRAEARVCASAFL